MTAKQSRWFAPIDGDAWIMGVLNCTPDSFSDGGMHTSLEDTVRHAESMWQAGAAIVDAGGESTRPGAKPISEKEELARVIPVIEALDEKNIHVSIDTSKAEVIRQAIAAGACMVNDVTALAGDSASLDVVAKAGVDVCLMHMRGTPAIMQTHVHYDNVVDEVMAFLDARVAACTAAGVAESAILLDPGIGFGKRLEDNLALIAAIPRFKKLGFPVLMGVSRKSFLGELTGASVGDREIETAAAVTACVYAGADVVRVHDVPAQARTVKIASAVRRSLPEPNPGVLS
ncbi:MAG: dihydropteroate synthase [Mariprofundaceae bacterium]|nr:dihydropteroate synthase [Mariprofundaceae bacterium]